MSTESLAAESDDSFIRSIIDRLEGDFQNEGKTTCRSCLRSKALPCCQVSEIASSSSIVWMPSLVIRMQEILLNEYTTFPSDTSDNQKTGSVNATGNVTIKSMTSLSCISRSVTALRFVQLLLLLKQQKSELTNQHLTKTATDSEHWSLSDDQVHNLIVNMLEQWTKGIVRFVLDTWKECNITKSMRIDPEDDNKEGSSSDNKTNSYNAMTADASSGLDPRPVFCFAFLSLLRMNEYVNTCGQMLVPIWNSVDSLADLLVEICNNDQCADDWHNSIPSSLLPSGIQMLSDYLKEGKHRLERSVVSYLESRQDARRPDTNVSTLAFQAKLLGFIAVKMSHLMRVNLTFHQSCDTFQQTKEPNYDLMSECWQSLFGLRGMATAFQLMIALRQTKATTQQANKDEDMSYLKALCNIAAKIGRVVQLFLSVGPWTRKCGDQQLSRPPILKSALDSFFMAGESGNNTTKANDQCSIFHEMSQAFGIVSLLLMVLTNSDDITSDTPEARLAIVERLLFVFIPRCQLVTWIPAKVTSVPSKCATLPAAFLYRSLVGMLRVLRGYESNEKLGRNELYRLLMRWLAAACPENANGYQHPSSRELVLTLVQAFVTGTGSKQSAATMISYLTKILFDPRASPTLQNNAAALLVRLQASSNYESNELSRYLVEKEACVWIEKCFKFRLENRNRRRNRMKLLEWNPQRLAPLCFAVRGKGLSEYSIDHLEALLFPTAIRALYEACIASPVESEKKLLPDSEIFAVLLAFLDRLLNSGTECIGIFSRVSGLEIVSYFKVVLNAVSALQCHDDDDVCIKLKKIMLWNAGLEISATLNKVLGECNSMTVPVDAIGSLASKSMSKKISLQLHGNDVSRYRPMIHFSVLKVLKTLGSVIPSECDDHLLQRAKKSFVRLLSFREWPVVSFGITSISVFGTTLHQNHKHIVRQCVPESCFDFVQCRIQKKIWRDKSLALVETDESALSGRTVLRLEKLCGLINRNRDSNFFPSTASISVDPGSFMLEMDTQEGRKAWVIFRSGLQSLTDIEYMLGETRHSQSVFKLKRVVATTSGGARCLLHAQWKARTNTSQSG